MPNMAKRHNHYEAAFEELLRAERLPYVAIDEKRRSLAPDGPSLKSADFLVSPAGEVNWIIDIKGRRFPSGKTNKQYWRNWSTRDDLRSLAEWARHFGPPFTPALVFAYHVTEDRSPLAPKNFGSTPTGNTLSLRSVWPTTYSPLVRSRPSGTRSRCLEANFANVPAAGDNGWLPPIRTIKTTPYLASSGSYRNS